MTHFLETFEMSIDHQEDGLVVISMPVNDKVKQPFGLVVISMPVNDKVKQPFGYLHGGASIALGETACSLGSATLIATTKFIPLG
ncbi:PaaI family thioesterase, partial [Staphylococcus aureus]|uniref:PaaI family thioesterase n=1 Tax=Staphylococcus aureus TaxID=1280 RepID=UPI000AC7930D